MRGPALLPPHTGRLTARLRPLTANSVEGIIDKIRQAIGLTNYQESQ